MKYIITEHQRERTIKKYLTYKLEPHEEKTSRKYPNSIFWVKKGEVIVEIKNSKDFWIDQPIWKEISDTFSIEYKELQRIIKEWLDEHYNLGGLRPGLAMLRYYNSWRNIMDWGD